MNRWIAIPVIAVLAIGIIVVGYFLQQQTDKLGEAESEILALEGNVAALQTKLTELEATVSTLEAKLAVATFPDLNLEAAIREAIGKPTGDIYRSDLERLTTLFAARRDISDLTGLEYCTNLTELWLDGNQISDISPLSYLEAV